MSKKYGLIERNTEPALGVPAKKHAAFASDSDSDGGEASKVKIELGANQKRQALAMQKKAIEEDPTIFQYDELYDDIVEKREKVANQGKEQAKERKPKYIEKLMETAERRKKEQERRVERRLEEMKKLEEQEKREEYLESIGDVTKQSDLGGFYRHIYEQKTKDEEKAAVKEETPGVDSEVKAEVKEESPEKSPPRKVTQRERKYRKRKSDDENEEQTANDGPAERTHLQSNLDADSDFSIDSESSEESESESEEKKVKVENNGENNDGEKESNGHAKEVKAEGDDADKKEDAVKVDADEPVVKKPKAPPIDIWKKRTVGEVFEAARQRYLERRQMQQSG
ncbi:hypothetical protein ZHAS_00019291 [Anopheles sinensis]|uniref:DUF2040 domain-containing protein n=1 Tax=Anopheles sinensis TaxID=74873 RepID=A0A084WM04_ANOSI|nr:hypothetical protein ZHAS_00019291 [Anopheles sinensis]